MRILYLISVHGHGRGGHFHSLNHISAKLAEIHNVKIITIGPGRSPVLETNPWFAKHIRFNGFNYIHLDKEISSVTDSFAPDLFHCFDEGSFNALRIIVSSKMHRIVLSKCGGPNPRTYSLAPNIMLFSLENQLWFKNNPRFKDVTFTLVPNRVQPIRLSKATQSVTKPKGIFCFLRICRIGNTYRKSIFDALNLVSELLNRNIKNIRLYVIGAIEERSLYNQLLSHPLVKDGFVEILHQNDYTAEASQMLYLADAVIGTGRGVMEAASLSLPILTANKTDNVPTLLDETTFPDAFKTNFSERNIFCDYSRQKNLDKIGELVCSTLQQKALGQFSQSVFNRYFDIGAVKQSYSSFYMQASTSKRNLIIDAPQITKSAVSFFRSYFKTIVK